MDHFRRSPEVQRGQRQNDNYLGEPIPQHRLPPAERRDGTFKQWRPQRAGEIAAARNQRQRRAAPAIEPAADIYVHRRINAAEPDQADEKSMPDPQWPGRVEGGEREARADHQGTADNGPTRADTIGDAAHEDAAGARAEPGE